MHQVVMNLMTNALFAVQEVVMPSIELSLGLTSQPADEPFLLEGGYAHLVVRDNGPGMDTSTRNRAFDPFFTTKGPQEGAGMGLAIVHGIVSTAGGAIRLESSVGAGTSVHVYWPTFPR
jgi:C4-dicarboxylate-specific signal transduction histidine kinase